MENEIRLFSMFCVPGHKKLILKEKVASFLYYITTELEEQFWTFGFSKSVSGCPNIY